MSKNKFKVGDVIYHEKHKHHQYRINDVGKKSYLVTLINSDFGHSKIGEISTFYFESEYYYRILPTNYNKYWAKLNEEIT